MEVMHIINLNGKEYRTTSSSEAWAFCSLWSCLVEATKQTNSVIEGVEYVEKSMWEMHFKLMALCGPLAFDWT